MQESALADVAGVRARAVGVDQLAHVPAAVLGERRDAVAALGDQLPQLLGRTDAAGVAAAHADDRDQVVVTGRRLGHEGRGRRVGVLADEFGAQVTGERLGRRVVEDEGGGQPDPGGRGELVAQVDRGQRVEAQLGEGPVGLQVGVGRVAEHRGDVPQHQAQQLLLAGGGGQGAQAVAEPAVGLRPRGPAGGGAHETAHHRRDASGVAAHGGRVERHGDEHRFARGEGRVEQR